MSKIEVIGWSLTKGVEAGDISFIMVICARSLTDCFASPRRSMVDGSTDVM